MCCILMSREPQTRGQPFRIRNKYIDAGVLCRRVSIQSSESRLHLVTPTPITLPYSINASDGDDLGDGISLVRCDYPWDVY